MKTLTEFIGEKEEDFDIIFTPVYAEVECSVAEDLDVKLKNLLKRSLTERNDYLKEKVGEMDRAVWNDGEGKEMQVYVLLSDVKKLLE